MVWTENPIFFVDFEGSRASGVLEYGVATLLGGKIVETKTRICAATGPVSAQDTNIHGLGADELEGAATLAADWDYFAGLRERGPFAAHYAGAENSLIKSVWPYPRRSPDFVRLGGWIVDWGPWIDTARIYAQLYPQFESGRLEELVRAARLQGELDLHAASHCPADRRCYHSALYDALAGALLLGSLARLSQCAGLSVGQLLALSTLDGQKRDRMGQGELW
jgi:DNA polymerase-3 subunit epsilon